MTTEPVPIVSERLADGTLLETVYDEEAATTSLAIGYSDGRSGVGEYFDAEDGRRLVPYSASNNLISSKCVLLASNIGDMGDKGDLLNAIREYLDAYVDLSPSFAELAPHYVLLTWVYDAFSEMPMLRFRGDYGTGKTRALLAVGSLCYKPFFASGASTVSPIFHILDAFRGTLVLDEADFRFSDMTGELIKVLNNGTTDGLPVLRTMANRHRELNPRAFRVYGPKLVAMREQFQDAALESRFFTERTGRRPLPQHIPINTPASMRTEARALRNRLLSWRFQHWSKVGPDATRLVGGAEPRLNQMALPLLSLIDEPEVRARVAAALIHEGDRRREDQLNTQEARVLSAIVRGFEDALGPVVYVADIATRFNQASSERYDVPLSHKAIGAIIREKLGIATAKYHGRYGIGQEERDRIRDLADRLGMSHRLPPRAPSSRA